MVLLVAIISFLLGFFVNLIALPYVVGHLSKECLAYVKNISMKSISDGLSHLLSLSLSVL